MILYFDVLIVAIPRRMDTSGGKLRQLSSRLYRLLRVVIDFGLADSFYFFQFITKRENHRRWDGGLSHLGLESERDPLQNQLQSKAKSEAGYQRKGRKVDDTEFNKILIEEVTSSVQEMNKCVIEKDVHRECSKEVQVWIWLFSVLSATILIFFCW